MAIQRSVQGDATVEYLLSAAKTCQTSGVADQGAINCWAYEKNLLVDLLPLTYNYYWGALPNARPRYRFWDAAGKLTGDVRLIHFSHALKPWNPNAPANCPAVELWRKYYALKNGPNLERLFDGVFVINLDQRRDRWLSFCLGLPADWPLGVPQRVSAIDGNRVGPPAWWGSKFPANAPAWGCFRSHLRIIEESLNRQLRSILIFEDDAVFVPDFTAKFAAFMQHIPSDWEMLYLGGWHVWEQRFPPRCVNEHVLQCTQVICNHAYAIRGEAIGKVYRHLTSNSWSPRMAWDNHLACLHKSLTVYAPRQFLVGQAAGRSDISGKMQPARFTGVRDIITKQHDQPESIGTDSGQEGFTTS
jgi:hypothetical protein